VITKTGLLRINHLTFPLYLYSKLSLPNRYKTRNENEKKFWKEKLTSLMLKATVGTTLEVD